LVVDPFVGSGTSLVAARDLNRNAVGFDLNVDYVALCRERLNGEHEHDSRQIALQDDALNIPCHLEPETVSLLWTSPPYANLLNRKKKNKSRRGNERQNDQFMKVEQYSQDARERKCDSAVTNCATLSSGTAPTSSIAWV
jgi:DNA modification methylase